jgi:hypothetical protein
LDESIFSVLSEFLIHIFRRLADRNPLGAITERELALF